MSTTEIMEAMKEMFRDVLQQVLESELDAELEMADLTNCNAMSNTQWTFQEKTA